MYDTQTHTHIDPAQSGSEYGFIMLNIAYASNTKMINKVSTMRKRLC